MKLPPFFYVKAFWEFLGLAVGGVLGLLYIFGVIPFEWVLAPTALTSLFLSVLKFFNIEPQLRARALALKAQSKKAKK